MLLKDPFDEIEPDKKQLTIMINRQFAQGTTLCNSIKSEHLSPDLVRKQLALRTLAHLDQPIAGCGNITWDIFWNNNIFTDKNRYFTGYNLDVPEFNQEGTLRQKAGTVSCDMKNPDGRYAEFILKRHFQTIEADVRLLYWARQYMAE